MIKLLVFTSLTLALVNGEWVDVNGDLIEGVVNDAAATCNEGPPDTCALQAECLDASITGNSVDGWDICLAYTAGTASCNQAHNFDEEPTGGCCTGCRKCKCQCAETSPGSGVYAVESTTCEDLSHVCCGAGGFKDITGDHVAGSGSCDLDDGNTDEFCCNEDCGAKPSLCCPCADEQLSCTWIGIECGEECVAPGEPDTGDRDEDGCEPGFAYSYDTDKGKNSCIGDGVCAVDAPLVDGTELSDTDSCDGTICCQHVNCLDPASGGVPYAAFGFKDGNAIECTDTIESEEYFVGGLPFDCSGPLHYTGEGDAGNTAICDKRSGGAGGCQWRVGTPIGACNADCEFPSGGDCCDHVFCGDGFCDGDFEDNTNCLDDCPNPAMKNEEDDDVNVFGIKDASQGETAGIYIAIIGGAAAICIVAAIFIYGLKQKQKGKENEKQMVEAKNNENGAKAGSQTVGTPVSPVSMESNQSELNVEMVTTEAINEL